MREKYILRLRDVEADLNACVLGIYYTPSPSSGTRTGWRVISTRRAQGTLTIGGPKVFTEEIDELLTRFFGIERGLEDERVYERQKDTERKRLVYDVKPIPLSDFRFGVRRMKETGISVTRVNSTGRLMR